MLDALSQVPSTMKQKIKQEETLSGESGDPTKTPLLKRQHGGGGKRQKLQSSSTHSSIFSS